MELVRIESRLGDPVAPDGVRDADHRVVPAVEHPVKEASQTTDVRIARGVGGGDDRDPGEESRHPPPEIGGEEMGVDDVEAVLFPEGGEPEDDREILPALLGKKGHGNAQGFELAHQRAQAGDQADRQRHPVPVRVAHDVQQELLRPVGGKGREEVADRDPFSVPADILFAGV